MLIRALSLALRSMIVCVRLEAEESDNRRWVMNAPFTKQELMTAAGICRSCAPRERNRMLVDKVVRPAMPRINKATGQENDERHLGYLLEHLIWGAGK